MTLKDFFKKSMLTDRESFKDLLEEQELRFCSCCGKAFIVGYYDSGDYYCENCLPYSTREWIELCNEYPDECYWSEWEGDAELARLYNECIEEEI